MVMSEVKEISFILNDSGERMMVCKDENGKLYEYNNAGEYVRECSGSEYKEFLKAEELKKVTLQNSIKGTNQDVRTIEQKEFDGGIRNIKSKAWDGEGNPPVGERVKFFIYLDIPVTSAKGVCEIVAYHNNRVWIQTEGYADRLVRKEHIKFAPIEPEKKIVDMSLFAGTDILLTRRQHIEIYTANDVPSDLIGRYKPIYMHHNAVSDLEYEPDYLEPFEYEVLEAYSDCGEVLFHKLPSEGCFSWYNVCHITILGLKDGWEFEK